MEVAGLAGSLLNRLREKILTSQFGPGEKINEIKLASGLGISRSPLREALRVLENEGLVVTSPRRGTYVGDLTKKNLTEIFQMREMIECYAVDLMKQKKIRQLPELSSIAERTRQMAMPSADDTPERKLAYIENLAYFHFKLVAAAQNGRLLKSYMTVHHSINRYVYFYAYIQALSRHRDKEHHDVLKLIGKGSYEEAKSQLRSHIRFSAEDLLKKM